MLTMLGVLLAFSPIIVWVIISPKSLARVQRWLWLAVALFSPVIASVYVGVVFEDLPREYRIIAEINKNLIIFILAFEGFSGFIVWTVIYKAYGKNIWENVPKIKQDLGKQIPSSPEYHHDSIPKIGHLASMELYPPNEVMECQVPKSLVVLQIDKSSGQAKLPIEIGSFSENPNDIFRKNMKVRIIGKSAGLNENKILIEVEDCLFLANMDDVNSSIQEG